MQTECYITLHFLCSDFWHWGESEGLLPSSQHSVNGCAGNLPGKISLFPASGINNCNSRDCVQTKSEERDYQNIELQYKFTWEESDYSTSNWQKIQFCNSTQNRELCTSIKLWTKIQWYGSVFKTVSVFILSDCDTEWADICKTQTHGTLHNHCNKHTMYTWDLQNKNTRLSDDSGVIAPCQMTSHCCTYSCLLSTWKLKCKILCQQCDWLLQLSFRWTLKQPVDTLVKVSQFQVVTGNNMLRSQLRTHTITT